MTKNDILNDLDYVRTMAEEGQNAPLLGGRFGLWWGGLLSTAFLAHWAIISGIAGLGFQYLGVLWLGFAVIGMLGSWKMGNSLQGKPGLSSVGNRAETIIWTYFGTMMAICFVGLVAHILIYKAAPTLFGMMVCIGFAGQAMANFSVAKLARQERVSLSGIASAITSVICFVLYDQPALYLVATVGMLLCAVLPSIAQIRAEPREVI